MKGVYKHGCTVPLSPLSQWISRGTLTTTKRFPPLLLALVLALGSTNCHRGAKVYDATASTEEGVEFVRQYNVKYICKNVIGFCGGDFLRANEHVYTTNVEETKGKTTYNLISDIELSRSSLFLFGLPAKPTGHLWIEGDPSDGESWFPREKTWQEWRLATMIGMVNRYGLKPRLSWWDKYGVLVVLIPIALLFLVAMRSKPEDLERSAEHRVGKRRKKRKDAVEVWKGKTDNENDLWRAAVQCYRQAFEVRTKKSDNDNDGYCETTLYFNSGSKYAFKMGCDPNMDGRDDFFITISGGKPQSLEIDRETWPVLEEVGTENWIAEKEKLAASIGKAPANHLLSATSAIGL